MKTDDTKRNARPLQSESAGPHLPLYINEVFLPSYMVSRDNGIFERIMTLLSTTNLFAQWVRTQDGIGDLTTICKRLNSYVP